MSRFDPPTSRPRRIAAMLLEARADGSSVSMTELCSATGADPLDVCYAVPMTFMPRPESPAEKRWITAAQEVLATQFVEGRMQEDPKALSTAVKRAGLKGEDLVLLGELLQTVGLAGVEVPDTRAVRTHRKADARAYDGVKRVWDLIRTDLKALGGPVDLTEVPDLRGTLAAYRTISVELGWEDVIRLIDQYVAVLDKAEAS